MPKSVKCPTLTSMESANRRRARKPLSDRTNSNAPSLSASSSTFNKCITSLGTIGVERKSKKKGVANPVPVSSRPIPKISNTRDRSHGVEVLDLPKTKPLTVPWRKKQCVVSYEQDRSKDAQLQDFIEKQKAYFKEIDEFELSEEEVESTDELD